MYVDFRPLDPVAGIRARLDHPVIDGDGHLLEYVPLLLDYVTECAGRDVAHRVRKLTLERSPNRPVATAWGTPTKNTTDRATAIFPELLRDRLDQFGIDYSLLYPGLPLVMMAVQDEEIRRAVVRASNMYYADVYGAHRDRMEAVAAIPTFTPEEAIEELEYVVLERGMKAVVLEGIIAERQPTGEVRIRGLGHGSPYDYDPLWQRCRELRVVPTFHTPGRGLGSRTSPTNYVFNHLGHFAWAQEAACRSLIFAGVPMRFPDLPFAFLEGGVSWGCQMFADMLSHFEKRNREAMANYDPRAIDVALMEQLFDRYASPGMRPFRADLDATLRPLAQAAEPQSLDDVDDFKESLIQSADDIVAMFTRQFYFGCEGDDPLTALAFRSEFLPGRHRLNPIFASDIGHWDVPDMRQVLIEAWELVEHGTIDEEEFKDFTCANVARMHLAVNPDFFVSTAVEGQIKQVLA
ncbi:MAG: amidohydrolase family protein [Actinomycetota bacterium]|nr:amidohydrolase family protein [Actinomycetota bacterium]